MCPECGSGEGYPHLSWCSCEEKESAAFARGVASRDAEVRWSQREKESAAFARGVASRDAEVGALREALRIQAIHLEGLMRVGDGSGFTSDLIGNCMKQQHEADCETFRTYVSAAIESLKEAEKKL